MTDNLNSDDRVNRENQNFDGSNESASHRDDESKVLPKVSMTPLGSEPSGVDNLYKDIDSQFEEPVGRKRRERTKRRSKPLRPQLKRQRKALSRKYTPGFPFQEMLITDRCTYVLNKIQLADDIDKDFRALLASCKNREELYIARRVLDFIGPMTAQYSIDMKDVVKNRKADFVSRLRSFPNTNQQRGSLDVSGSTQPEADL